MHNVSYTYEERKSNAIHVTWHFYLVAVHEYAVRAYTTSDNVVSCVNHAQIYYAQIDYIPSFSCTTVAESCENNTSTN